MTTTIDRAIELNVPVSTAYDQWTQFEDFPLFMEGVEAIEQVTDERLRWKIKRRGVEREFGARITEQHPNLRIAWTAHGEDDPDHSGVVTFHYLDDDRTRLMLQLRFVPSGFFEQYADKMGLVENWIDDTLQSFKEFIEQRGKATGSWRGRIEHDEVTEKASHERHDGADRRDGTERREDGDGKLDSVKDASSDRDRDASNADRSTPRETASSGSTPEGSEARDQHRAVDHRTNA